jgi:hypothetical protein
LYHENVCKQDCGLVLRVSMCTVTAYVAPLPYRLVHVGSLQLRLGPNVADCKYPDETVFWEDVIRVFTNGVKYCQWHSFWVRLLPEERELDGVRGG